MLQQLQANLALTKNHTKHLNQTMSPSFSAIDCVDGLAAGWISVPMVVMLVVLVGGNSRCNVSGTRDVRFSRGHVCESSHLHVSAHVSVSCNHYYIACLILIMIKYGASFGLDNL
jgi:UDP-N-acetylmuramyl pentapeptide phosphotransferase/UDP-N-acetylglucosamine-1-phosphate transferase